ncbi:MAG: PAC2 family protein [Anaerolineae bacterium]|nr:PAC2 family protein [Anaerolineae bacterium]
MDDLIELWEEPAIEHAAMIVGWRQWADGGAVSSELPRYLIEHTHARHIGILHSDPFYIFQVPGTHALFRPEIKLENGYRAELREKRNEIYLAENDGRPLVIFLGDEPQLNVARYARAFFDVARALRVRRIVAIGGVYGNAPYDKDREITCTYSLPRLKDELNDYAVTFSNYEGGVSIGSYLLDRAEKLGIEYIVFYAIVPMFDLTQLSPLLQTLVIEQDHKAWYDVMRRVNHMFQLGLDLSELERASRQLIASFDAKIDELEKAMPQVNIRAHIKKLTENFVEPSFMPLDDVWKKGLGDLIKDL